MLTNLKAEMARRGITNLDLQKELNYKTPKTIYNKIYGISEFTRSEIYIISTKFFPDIDMIYLFTSKEDKK